MLTFPVLPISRTRALPPLTCTALMLVLSATAFAETVVVTDSLYPFPTHSGSQKIYLDLPASLDAELSAGFPTDPAKAQTIFQQRLTPNMASRLTKAHQDVAIAWSLGITRYPAVVVDRQYVVYGETDIQRAIDRIEQFRKAQP